MLQVYLLIIVTNLIVGVILVDEFYPIWIIHHLREQFQNNKWSLGVALWTAFTGFFAFLGSVTSLFILGDLFPSLTLFACSAVFLVRHGASVLSSWEQRTDGSQYVFHFLQFFYQHRLYVGITAIIAGVMHFFFPDILLL